MASIKESQVVYIEPNAEESLGTAYKVEGDSTVMKFADPEDFCIVVDLEVEVKGRTFYYSKVGSDKNIKFEAVENATGQKVRFMEGSKIYTNKEKTEYITSLTTNYTDCTLQDVENGGTCEMFGIKSIDISYNHFMVPEVTIQFVDVRGVSLFAQEELRHNLTNTATGMQGNVNNDIQGSFFKCFFTFPYPKFTLKVKGFYGEMVSYELTCSDFRAAFESSTGNFNVTAKFVGYAFSFLNDVMSNAILASPFSTYVGKEYWEKNNGTRFLVKDKNGQDIAMTPLMEICKSYNKTKEDVEKKLAEGGLDEELERQGRSEEDKEKLKNYELKEQRERYRLLTDDAKQKGFQGSGNGECVVTASTHSFAIFVDDSNDYETYRGVAASYKAFNDELKQVENCAPLKNWLGSHEFKLVEYSDYCDITGSNDKTISGEKITDSKLKDAIEAQANKQDNGDYYYELWTNWDNSHVFVYIDDGLYDILGAASDTNVDDAQEVQALREEVTNTAINHAIEDIFNFPPTLENVTKIIMAHFETYAYMISHCATQIINSGTARTASNLGLSQDMLNDVPEGDNDGSLVPPFPSVTENKTDENGNDKKETTWIGKYDNANKFEEVKLVNGLLEGIEKTATIAAAVVSEQMSNEGTAKPEVNAPICVSDLLLTSGDKVFGQINMADANNVFAHVAMRGFTAMAITKKTGEADTIGSSDAENFIDVYGKNSNIKSLKDTLTDGAITGEYIYNYLASGDLKNAPNKSAKNNPWYVGKSIFTMSSSDSSKCVTNIGGVEPNQQGRVLPIKNWTFAQLKEISGGQNHKFVEKNSQNFFCTPLPKESYNSNLYLCDIRYKSCKYFESANNTLGLTIDTPDKALETYNVNVYNDSTKKGAEVIKYENTGAVSNAEEFTLSGGDCFGKEDYYQTNDVFQKAKMYLNTFTILPTSKIEKIFQNQQNICAIPKLFVLQIGAYLWDLCEVQKKDYFIRKAIQGKLIREFKNWAKNGNFNNIRSSYEFQFLNGKSFTTLKESLNKLSPDASLKENCSNYDNLKYVYNIGSKIPKGVKVSPNVCTASKHVSEDLCQIAHIVLTSRFNKNDYETFDENGPSVEINKLKTYLNSFVNKLREKLNVSTEKQESNEASTTIEVSSDDNDDIKFGVYVYLKMLYDKWISSDLSIQNYKFETMFTGSDPTYHFIDSYYNNIGKSYYINIATLVKMCVDSQTQNGYSLLSLLSNLYASNKMQFLCLQNFANLANIGMMEKMFKPIPYIDMQEPSNHPDFVVLYPGETSSKLEIKDGDFKDDGFYLNERASWPVMIKNKQPGGYPVPAFGVSYGQQYQSYFKNIQVDMNTPMVTEQSIKAKFMIAGGMTGNDNNGPKQITVGQDLYTIYSNNSYQCTVTMMGCAWVQPMMYFVLLNVPMFRGSYMIFKVNHQIQAGTMTTTFTGVRMANTATRAVKKYIAGQNNDSTNGDGTSPEANGAAQANLGNDCDYASYSPLGSSGGLADFSGLKVHNNRTLGATEPNADQRKNMSDILPIIKTEGTALKYNVPWTVIAAMCEHESQWASSVIYKGKTPSTSTAKGIGQFLYSTAKLDLFKTIFSNLVKTDGVADDRNVPQKCVKAMVTYINHNLDLYAGKFPEFKTEPMKLFLVALSQYGSSDSTAKATAAVLKSRTVQQAVDANVLPTTNGTNHYLKFVYKVHSQYAASSTTPNTGSTSGDTISQLISGFTNAVQSSLNASDSYKEVKLSYEEGKKGKDWALIQIKGTGNNAMNAAFDCISTTYADYWEYLYWSVGNGNANNDCVGVVVKLKSSKPTTHRLGVCKNFVKGDSSAQPIKITKKEDVNNSFKLAAIKHCRKEGISDVTKFKACFGKTFGDMPDETIKKVFELGGIENSAVQSCNSIAGTGNNSDGTRVKDTVPTKFQKGDTKHYNLVLHRYKEVGTNILGRIYEFDTGNILCYTIENTKYVYSNNRPNVQPGLHVITPGGNSWPSVAGYHQGCSSYTVSIIGGKCGFGSRTGAPNTMLRIGNSGGCLFHPGKDSSWSEGCILIGNKANDSTGKRAFNTNNYYAGNIRTTSEPAVVAYRNFYDHVTKAMLAGKTPQIEIVKNYSVSSDSVPSTSLA